MKKLLALLLALAMCVAMFACGGNEDKKEKDEDNEEIVELKEEIEALEDEIAELEEELKEAEDDEDDEKIEELEAEIEEKEEELKELEEELEKLEGGDDDEVDYDDLDEDELEEIIEELEDEIADLEDELDEAEDDEDDDKIEELEEEIEKLEKELKKAEKALKKLTEDDEDGDTEETRDIVAVTAEATEEAAQTTAAETYWDEPVYTNSAVVRPLPSTPDSGKVYKFVSDNAYVPFEYYDGSEYVGFDMDLLAAIAEDQGFEYTIENIGWDASLARVQSGQADAAIMAITVTEEREETFDFSDTYFEDGITIITSDTDDSIWSIADLRGKQAGALSWCSYYVDDLAEEYGFTVVYYENSGDLYTAVQNGTCIAGFDWYSNACYAIFEDELPLWSSGEKFYADSLVMAVKDGEDAELIEMFNEGLENIIENGKYAEICYKYGFIY